MAKWLGDFALGDTVTTKFTTVNSSGTPSALTSASCVAYAGLTATPISSGITTSASFNSITGLNHITAVLTAANGYAAGSNYQLVLASSSTVNSISIVGYEVAEFSIQNRAPQINATGATQAVGVADAGTLQSATGTTAVIRSGASATDSIYNGHTLFIASGTGAGQSRLITGYVGSSKTATVDTWTTNPDSSSLYVVIATPPGSTVSPIPANATQFAGQTITAAAGVTIPSSLASPTNITAATGIDITKILGTTIATPATAGILDINVKNMNNVAATAITTIKAVQGLATDGVIVTVSGNVNGSVGSVTGAVGSVTGAVGSVTGAVGSVTGAVGSVTGNVGGNVVGSVGSLTTNNDKTGYRLDATGSATLTESYATKGAGATLPALLYSTLQALTEFSTSGTTITIKKRDQSTTAFTETLDSSATPTSITQAT